MAEVEAAGGFYAWISGALFTVTLGITGTLYKLQDRRIGKVEDGVKNLSDAVPLAYRSKTDCKDICEAFKESADALRESLEGFRAASEANFKTLHEYLRQDVGNLHKRIDDIVQARKTCKCQEGE